MEALLNEINSILGVRGSFICTPDGRIAAKAVPEPYDADSLDIVARVVSQTFRAIEMSRQHVTEMNLVFSQEQLLLKNLRVGVLVILCARQLNLPLLNLIANATAQKITAALKSSKSQIPSPTAIPLPVPAPTTSVSEQQPTQAAVVERMDAKFFEELAHELAGAIGPLAAIIVEDEINALKETREAFPKGRAIELIERVGVTIHDESRRARFRQTMLELLRRL